MCNVEYKVLCGVQGVCNVEYKGGVMWSTRCYVYVEYKGVCYVIVKDHS